MEVVVDEILQLSSVQMYDAYRRAPFQLKVDVLLDYPGIGKMFNISGSGAYKACLWCDIKGKCMHVILPTHMRVSFNTHSHVLL